MHLFFEEGKAFYLSKSFFLLERANSYIFLYFSYQAHIPWGYAAKYQAECRNHGVLTALFLGTSGLQRPVTFCHMPIQGH